MLIGIDASRANRKYKTGTEWYAFYLIKNLLQIDQSNHYILYSDQPFTPELISLGQNRARIKFQVLAWPFSFFWTLGRLSLEMLWRPPHVLFVPAHTLPIIHPKRSLITIHDVAFKSDADLYDKEMTKQEFKHKKGLNRLIKLFTFGRYRYNALDYLNWSTKFGVKYSKKIITVSGFTKRDLVKYYHVKPEKVAIVHNGYNKSLYKIIEQRNIISEKTNKYGISSPYILYVGRLERKKNTPLLIESFALLRENHPEIKEKLVLVGTAGYGYDEIKYIIEEFNLGDEVIMSGWVDEVDMPYLYNGASAFVFPTKHEGFGIPVIEALACGTPVAASDIPVLREVAGDSVLYFDCEDKDDISEKLYSILSDASLRERLRSSGQKRCQDFDWEKTARETLDVINTL